MSIKNVHMSERRKFLEGFQNANLVFFYPNEATLAFFHPQVNV